MALSLLKLLSLLHWRKQLHSNGFAVLKDATENEGDAVLVLGKIHLSALERRFVGVFCLNLGSRFSKGSAHTIRGGVPLKAVVELEMQRKVRLLCQINDSTQHLVWDVLKTEGVCGTKQATRICHNGIMVLKRRLKVASHSDVAVDEVELIGSWIQILHVISVFHAGAQCYRNKQQHHDFQCVFHSLVVLKVILISHRKHSIDERFACPMLILLVRCVIGDVIEADLVLEAQTKMAVVRQTDAPTNFR